MLKLKKLFNLKTICLLAMLVFLVACHFATRKIMAWDVELGMSRSEVHKILGKPMYSGPDAWELVVINNVIYRRTIIIVCDGEWKVAQIIVMHNILGHEFVSSRHNYLPLIDFPLESKPK